MRGAGRPKGNMPKYAVSCTRAKSFLTEEEEEEEEEVSPKVSRGGKSHEARHDTRSDLIVRAD